MSIFSVKLYSVCSCI